MAVDFGVAACYLRHHGYAQDYCLPENTCGWSAGVRAVLAKYDLPYTEKDIIQNPAFRWEMETKSGQPLSPCVEINDEMLSDISGEEVEDYLIESKLVQPSGADAGVPINAPCATEEHDSAVGCAFELDVKLLRKVNVKALPRSRAGLFNPCNDLTLPTMKFFARASPRKGGGKFRLAGRRP